MSDNRPRRTEQEPPYIESPSPSASEPFRRVVVIIVAIAAAAAALLLIAVLVIGRPNEIAAQATSSATPSTTASPSLTASPAPTSEPTPSSTEQPTATPKSTPQPRKALGPDAVAQVVATDLVTRSAPSVGQDSEIFDRLLSRPQLLYLLDGPVRADGYDWYLAAPFRVEAAPSNPPNDPIGWVAASSRDGEPWIAPIELECPGPTLEAVSGQSPIANLACYGGQQLALEGVFNGCFVTDPVTVVPSWLSGTGCSVLVPGSVPTAVPNGGVLVVRPAGGAGVPDEPGTTVLAEGQFDDPAAKTCSPLATGITPLEVTTAILWCRTQFVATDF